jgi:hypothetical protein
MKRRSTFTVFAGVILVLSPGLAVAQEQAGISLERAEAQSHLTSMSLPSFSKTVAPATGPVREHRLPS